MAKQNGKDGEVVDARADGQVVGKAKSEEDDDSLKTSLKPKTQKTLKIVEYESIVEEIAPKMIKSQHSQTMKKKQDDSMKRVSQE